MKRKTHRPKSRSKRTKTKKIQSATSFNMIGECLEISKAMTELRKKQLEQTRMATYGRMGLNF